MSRPHVVTHALVSADGKLDGFPQDVARYYEVAARLPHDAVLTGSGTMVAAAASAGVDLTQDDDGAASAEAAHAGAPLLVVIDSGGRVTRFDWLHAARLWSELLVVGSAATPGGHRDRLRSAGVGYLAAGDDRVDLARALEQLHADRGIDAVRVDAGPGLNTALLSAGLLDEISVVLAPYLVGRGRGAFDGFPGTAAALELAAVESLPDGYVWLRYTVTAG